MERSALLFRAPSTLQFTRWCKCAAWKRATPLSAERVESKKKKRKKGKLERLFTLSPASPRSSDSLRVSLGCHGYPEDSKPRRNCLHWMTAAEARAAWTEVFSERDRIDPELPGEKGAQKSTSPSFKCHAPGSEGCLGQCYFYARLLETWLLLTSPGALGFDKVPERTVHGPRRGGRGVG